MEIPSTILLVDDDIDAAASLRELLKSELPSDHFLCAHNAKDALDLVKRRLPEVCILDLMLEPATGIESGFALLKAILTHSKFTKIIVLTGHGNSDYGVRALTLGAAHFIQKPAEPSHLIALVNDAGFQSTLLSKYDALEQGVASMASVSLVGDSPQMKEVRRQVLDASRIDVPVLISGETGTGKGVCAKSIHDLGKRADGRFVCYYPTAGSGSLAGSELFGHMKGSFTGADVSRNGILSDADKGTLFLDEVDETPSEIQVALLRVLQEKLYRRIGEDRERKSDFRLISATNANIDEILKSGKLRKDFFHRIAYFHINLPPLRERKEDIAPLLEHFVSHWCLTNNSSIPEIDEQVYSMLFNYHYPGNVRELSGIVETFMSLIVSEERRFVRKDDIYLPRRRGGKEDLRAGIMSLKQQVTLCKKSAVREALALCNHNKTEAASLLEIDRSTLNRILDVGKK